MAESGWREEVSLTGADGNGASGQRKTDGVIPGAGALELREFEWDIPGEPHEAGDLVTQHDWFPHPWDQSQFLPSDD
jgi:hypothetical protein